MAAHVPEFSIAEWYRDHNDHRCPHDAWLESVEIFELATGQRKEKRKTAITIRLLGAYHDGHIIFRYSGVKRYSLTSGSCDFGHNDWMEDSISIVGSDGLLTHHIHWAAEESAWRIEAEEISFEWIPQKG